MLKGYCKECVWGAFLFRFSLGMLSLVAGVDKFIAKGDPFSFFTNFINPQAATAGFRGYLQKQFAESWLPSLITVPFGYVLPYAEVVIGLLIMLGLFRFFFLLLGSLVMLVLSFGMMVVGQHDIVARNMLYVFMYAAVFFTAPWDWICLDALFRRKKPRTEDDAPPGLRG